MAHYSFDSTFQADSSYSGGIFNSFRGIVIQRGTDLYFVTSASNGTGVMLGRINTATETIDHIATYTEANGSYSFTPNIRTAYFAWDGDRYIHCALFGRDTTPDPDSTQYFYGRIDLDTESFDVSGENVGISTQVFFSGIAGFSDGGCVLAGSDEDGARSMGSHVNKPVYWVRGAAGGWTKVLPDTNGAAGFNTTRDLIPYKGRVFASYGSGSAPFDTIELASDGTYASHSIDISATDYGCEPGQLQHGKSYSLGASTDMVFADSSAFFIEDPDTSFTVTKITLPSSGTYQPLDYFPVSATEIYAMGRRTDTADDANRYNIWNGTAWGTNTPLHGEDQSPEGAYQTPSGFWLDGSDVAFGICEGQSPVMFVSSFGNTADISGAFSRTISRTIAGAIFAADRELTGSFTRAITRAIEAELDRQSSELFQGFESRYQTNDPGELLQRNIYRAYVGAAEFPLYSVSAKFSGLDAYTGNPGGSAFITLKAPQNWQDFLTSQIGQEFIVLNGVETNGIFQGVEFVTGVIDSVKAAGALVVVTSSSTEIYASGAVATINSGVEFVSRQRIRIGQINPTVRPGFRVVTPRGTYDAADVAFYVSPNQKFMEIGAYG